VNESSPIAREAFPYLTVSLAVTLAFLVGGLWQGAVLCGLFACFVLFFFRNPERMVPTGPAQLCSPADGKVVFVGPSIEKDFLCEERTKVSIFMSLFDVHINRMPVDGVIKGTKYYPGRFLAAFDDRSSDENERNLVFVETPSGDTLVVVQIAGLVARRIVCYAGLEAFFAKGQRFGLIQFGSRVDVYLPKGALPLVQVGDRVKGGESLLAKLSGKEA
jgi:phosphatidylserine decarboxylase